MLYSLIFFLFLFLDLEDRDVVNGLVHLHELGIIHRDLKPQNVLIVKERSLCAKLSDMGISKCLTGDMASLGQHATGKYLYLSSYELNLHVITQLDVFITDLILGQYVD